MSKYFFIVGFFAVSTLCFQLACTTYVPEYKVREAALLASIEEKENTIESIRSVLSIREQVASAADPAEQEKLATLLAKAEEEVGAKDKTVEDLKATISDLKVGRDQIEADLIAFKAESAGQATGSVINTIVAVLNILLGTGAFAKAIGVRNALETYKDAPSRAQDDINKLAAQVNLLLGKYQAGINSPPVSPVS